MSILKSHTLNTDCGDHVASVKPADQAAVDFVLGKDEVDEHGRSNWVWVRLANGDLMLATFPQGDTYELLVNGPYRIDV